MLRSALLALTLLLAGGPALPAPPEAPRVLRYAFPIEVTSLDPAPISDLYSRNVISGIFEAPLEFAFLGRPGEMRPNTAAAMPEVSADFRSFTFHIQPGIYFAHDPAFKGRRRELVAQDYVYSIERHYDPRWKSANLYILENARILGLSALRRRALAERKPFDYDAPVEGLRALDRYTLRIRLREPRPRFVSTLCNSSIFGAVAREVV